MWSRASPPSSDVVPTTLMWSSCLAASLIEGRPPAATAAFTF